MHSVSGHMNRCVLFLMNEVYSEQRMMTTFPPQQGGGYTHHTHSPEGYVFFSAVIFIPLLYTNQTRRQLRGQRIWVSEWLRVVLGLHIHTTPQGLGPVTEEKRGGVIWFAMGLGEICHVFFSFSHTQRHSIVKQSILGSTKEVSAGQQRKSCAISEWLGVPSPLMNATRGSLWHFILVPSVRKLFSSC